MLIKDFDHFVDRQDFLKGYDGNISGKVASQMMLQLKGDEWKQVRAMMSPVFTSGKLKLMFKHIQKVGSQLEEYIKHHAAQGEMMEAKQLYSMSSLDSIATAGFGIEINSFKDPDNVFRKTALKMVRAPGYTSWTDSLNLFAFML